MPVPSPRNKILPARGNYADLLANLGSLGDGEICYALDQDKLYVREGSVLVDVSGSGGGGGAVDSVNGQTGTVVLDADDVGAPSDSEFSTLAGRVSANEVAQGNNIVKNNEQDGRLDSLESDVGNINTFSGDYNDLSNKPSIPSDLDDLVDVNAPSPSNGQFLQWNGSEWVPGAASGAPVDSVNGQTGVVVLDADDISDAATTNKYATQVELDKLAGIEAGAQVNTVNSVAGKTGTVTLVKGDVGLGNVDNTSDADKPVSTATQAALNAKADLANGVVPNSQLPSIAITEYLGEAADETAMLALDGQKGDWCIRTDTSSTWVVTGDDATELASWTELATPANAVSSVNGYTGTVVLAASDVGAAPSTINLQAVTDNGNTTTNDVDVTGTVTGSNLAAVSGTTDQGGINTNNQLQISRSGSDIYSGYLSYGRKDGSNNYAFQIKALNNNIPADIELCPIGGDVSVGKDKIVLEAGGSASFAGTINSSENTITGTWDLSDGNFWTCGAITIPNPTNATTGTSGLIRLTAAPTGWGANIKHPGGSAETISSFPAMVPFYVQDANTILLGKATQGIA